MLDDRTEPNVAFRSAKRLFAVAALGTAVGLATAGTLDRTAGGVLVVASWATAIWALHRLGRTGSERSLEEPPAPGKKKVGVPARKSDETASDDSASGETKSDDAARDESAADDAARDRRS